jgi:pyrroline-5-carboxylate reductase
LSSTEIVVVGFGNMGQALVRGWLARGRSPDSIHVVDPSPSARAQATELRIAASADIDTEVGALRPRVILLAVKPQQLGDALRRFASTPAPAGTLFLSIAAGKTIAEIVQGLGATVPVVRAMPNTPAAIGKGMTVLAANAAVGEAQRALCAELLGAVGRVAWVDEERHLDAVTGVSGSGPAYVFLLIECLEQAALDVGLSAELARELALATVAGAAEYAVAAGAGPDELRRRVTSPNGTTQAALNVLMGEGGLRELMSRAVRAATERSRELSSA